MGVHANAAPRRVRRAVGIPWPATIALCGDGGFTMRAMGDLLTQVERKTPVVHLFSTTESLDFVNIEMQRPHHSFGVEFRTLISPKSRGNGGDGNRIEEPGDVRDGLAERLRTRAARSGGRGRRIRLRCPCRRMFLGTRPQATRLACQTGIERKMCGDQDDRTECKARLSKAVRPLRRHGAPGVICAPAESSARQPDVTQIAAAQQQNSGTTASEKITFFSRSIWQPGLSCWPP